MSKKSNISTWDKHLEHKYGKPGTEQQEKFQQDFEAFKLGVLIKEARKNQNIT